MPRAVVMMATYNGVAFLGDQIRSIEKQNFETIDLIISDDGSTDGTEKHLDELQTIWTKGDVTILKGPQQGFSENYRHLILNAPPGADLYAYSDQDDIWLPGKLPTAAQWLAGANDAVPSLFCSRTEIVDEQGIVIGLSPKFSSKPAFRNAIVQSIAGGNTMVFNDAARKLLAESCRRTSFVSHDWWTYIIISGAGGRIHYSTAPQIRYRQHASNLIGANSSWRARMVRLVLMAGGRFARWNERNQAALEQCRDLLTDETKAMLDDFRVIRGGHLFTRLARLRRSGIYRQTGMGQFSLYLACILGKI